MDPASEVHGVPHWDRVAANARLLVSRIETGADLAVTVWFAYLHDCCRHNDAEDPEHGHRAAALARSLWFDGKLHLYAHEFQELFEAIRDHSTGRMQGPLLARICWDADRLDLPRVGTMPDPGHMCTTIGQKLAGQMKPKTKLRVGHGHGLLIPRYRRSG
jgi:uncharacterized protein